MNWLWALVAVLMLLGAVLAMAEAAVSRMTRIRAMALGEAGHRNAAVLERIETDPARYLNSIYLAVMLVQNGSAILVALLAQSQFGDLGITLISIGFTLLYFVVVEAMSKTFGILHSDRVALALSPLVWALGRLLAVPTRLLIGLANVLLPGRGLRQGPFVSEEEIRSMADVASEEAAIEEDEKELIHSIFEFGDTIVREVMVPRPDMVAAPLDARVGAVLDLILRRGFSRIPVFRETIDDIAGVVYAKDLLRHLHAGKGDVELEKIMRPAFFIPETKRCADLLKEMQQRAIHIAVVLDEYGATAGLVTIEDLLEELVGEIADEYDRAEPEIVPLPDGGYRVDGRMSVDDLSELLDIELPNEEWDTVAGLMYGLLGAVPTQGETVTFDGLVFTAEQVQGRRIAKVLVKRRETEQIAEGS